VATGKVYIALKTLLHNGSKESLFKDEKDFEILSTCTGKELVGKKYEPLFPYFSDRKDRAFRVICDT
jgi:isoleucyl-tRNA synthetase